LRSITSSTVNELRLHPDRMLASPIINKTFVLAVIQREDAAEDKICLRQRQLTATKTALKFRS
jgi:hypothetical protein